MNQITFVSHDGVCALVVDAARFKGPATIASWRSAWARGHMTLFPPWAMQSPKRQRITRRRRSLPADTPHNDR
ncbi:hypothetical protein ZHAS_00015903 [Anopheles sinensis]|uniref:Uncharacterized protein n=1 Tax=Anopheles sinensis TaxID=74873 RepID=A0A084WC85_ANOSI|nr:hypothetical protein ZHAS_00015903 [Anopheles sinensis]